MTAKPAATLRLIQSLNYTLHAREVGVMNVYEKDGAVVAHLSVFDPVTSEDDDVHVKANDEFLVGSERYQVATVVTQQGDQRAWLEVAPIGSRAMPD
jgi:hypothetical protein